jgi:hypothetical protein
VSSAGRLHNHTAALPGGGQKDEERLCGETQVGGVVAAQQDARWTGDGGTRQ